jgi:outer membrane protein assembly factor BamA
VVAALILALATGPPKGGHYRCTVVASSVGASSVVASSVVSGFSRTREADVLTQIEIHGNLVTSDAEVLRLADVQIGTPIESTTVDEVTARLRASRRFESVDVRKRFASIADPTQIVLVIIVDEGPVRIELTGDPNRPTRVVRNRRPRVMFLPILHADDGYGVTYGARLALPDPVGLHSRLSFPLSWGGDKRVAVELDKTLEHHAVDRVVVGGAISRRQNLFFDEDDDRTRVSVRAERQLARTVRASATAGWQHVSFGALHDSFAHVGVDVALDTRLDPVLPRNAVYARAAVERLGLPDAGMNTFEIDARGYLGLAGQNVLALRVLRDAASGPLPSYLRPVLGGMTNLRGFKAGTAIGDTLVAASAELIVPLTSPLSFGKLGISAFTDVGAAYAEGERLGDQTLRRGYGGSLWFSAAFVRVDLAVAHGAGASTRVHFGGNVSF